MGTMCEAHSWNIANKLHETIPTHSLIMLYFEITYMTCVLIIMNSCIYVFMYKNQCNLVLHCLVYPSLHFDVMQTFKQNSGEPCGS